MIANYPRNLRGRGRQGLHANWPRGACVALQFVVTYDEGSENSVPHGDAGSEQFLSEMFNPASFPDRHPSMEGIYEYGSRVGVWHRLREFEKHDRVWVARRIDIAPPESRPPLRS